MLYLTVGFALLSVVCVVNLILALGIIRRLREHAKLLSKRSGGPREEPGPMLSAGAQAAAFTATATSGEIVSTDLVREGTLFAFISAIARAIFRQGRDLVILDEPSSGLDAEAEHRVHGLMSGLREGQTTVLISHRLNAARTADTIVVIVDGKAAEIGTHEELLAHPGTYARLFLLQASGYIDVPTGASVT